MNTLLGFTNLRMKMEERITSLSLGVWNWMLEDAFLAVGRPASAFSHSVSLHRAVLIFKYSEITPNWPLLPDYSYDALHVR